ncbi:MAG: efflux RND transporter permease subunit, partial [Bdellovibrionales bacterium]|nr:efflux RND transporter permease subunit [Bdellovibrionales bacterium]
MKSILQFFIDNFRFTFLLTFLLIIMGLQGLHVLRKEARPPVDFATATVVTLYPGSSAEEVEEKITQKIEDEIRTVDGLRDVRSVSQAGRSEITIRVDMDNVNTDQVMAELQNSVQRVNGLPKDILDDPKFTRINAKEIPILEMALTGSNEDRKRDALAYRIKEELEDASGVSEVTLNGYREREFQILLDTQKMQRLNVGLSEVVAAVQGRTKNIPAGSIKEPKHKILVRVTGQVEKAEEMGNIVIRSNFMGMRIRVKDIAEVRDGMEDPQTLSREDGATATTLSVIKKAKSDTVETVADLKKIVKRYQDEYLPEGYKLNIYNNESRRVEEQLGIVINNATSGLILVLIILLIFLPGWLGIVTSLSLPVALLGSIGLMPIMGVTFNTITMLAFVIAIGMLVDNAVVISEN